MALSSKKPLSIPAGNFSKPELKTASELAKDQEDARNAQIQADQQLIGEDQAARDAKRKQVKDFFNRPAQYKRLLDAQIQLNVEILNLRIEQTKKINKLYQRFGIDNDLTQRSLPEEEQSDAYRQAKADLEVDETRVRDYYERKISYKQSQLTINANELRSLDDNLFGLKDPNRSKKSKEDRQKVREARKRERRNNSILKKEKRKQIIRDFKSDPNKFKIVSKGILVLANVYLQQVGVRSAKIEKLVDNVLLLIEDLKANPTPENISAARLERDLALQFIALQRNYLEALDKLINSINLLQTILSAILAILYLIPFPPFQPPKIFKTIDQISRAIEDLIGLVSTASFVVNLLIDDLNYQESRLKEATSFLDGNLEGLTADEIAALIGDGLGYLNGYDYKGFRFFLNEEENPEPENIIKGNKRRYAVALDTSNVKRLQSKYSFTLDPAVLVEELKVEIDKQNLVA